MYGLVIRLLILVFAFSFSGCVGSKESLEPPQEPAVSDEYMIGPEDVLEISVWQNQDLSRSVTVRPDGMISLPLIGDVHAAGLTPGEVKREIARALKPYMDEPNVAVILQQINSWRIYIQGEVRNPGVYPIRSRTTVSQAITMAGGFTEFAKKKKIQVIRKWKNHTEFIKVNYNKIVSGDTAQDDIVLEPGDTIVVP